MSDCDPAEVEFATCPDPECGAIAEVVDEWVEESTGAPLAHRLTLCLHRHRYTSLVRVQGEHNPKE